MNYREMHYKENLPEDTVSLLLKKLYSMGIKVSERWHIDNEANTASLRVCFKGTSIGSNGKGTTREYARASAYGELFERYQNGVFSENSDETREYMKKKYGFEMEPDELYYTAKELIDQNDTFVRYIFESMHVQDKSNKEKETAILSLVNEVDGQLRVFPFYSVKEKRVVYLPDMIYMKIYGSNGMAAGNTPEEAVVQGLSEIIERYVQKKIHLEKPNLPDIPDNVIMKYPRIWERFNQLRQNKNYNIMMKDCSMGEGYPVAALVISKVNTGEFGIKLGCHPEFEIAMERTITEASQGHNVVDYVNRSFFDFFNWEVDNSDNVRDGFRFGRAQFPYQVFSKTSDWEYKTINNDGTLSNRDYMLSMLEEFSEKGYDVLVREVSYLGLPSYHIIIPGISEISELTPFTLRASNTFHHAQELMSDVSQINEDNCKYIIASLNYYAKDIFRNRVRYYYKMTMNEKLPFESVDGDCIFLEAMCYILLKKYSIAYKKLRKLELLNLKRGLNEQEKIFLDASLIYLSGRCIKKSHEEVVNYIQQLFDKETTEHMDWLYEDSSQIISKLYPSREQLASSYAINEKELQIELTEKLRQQQFSGKIDQNNLSNLFNVYEEFVYE